MCTDRHEPMSAYWCWYEDNEMENVASFMPNSRPEQFSSSQLIIERSSRLQFECGMQKAAEKKRRSEKSFEHIFQNPKNQIITYTCTLWLQHFLSSNFCSCSCFISALVSQVNEHEYYLCAIRPTRLSNKFTVKHINFTLDNHPVLPPFPEHCSSARSLL